MDEEGIATLVEFEVRCGVDGLTRYATEFWAVAVLQKPFSVGQLVAAVRAAAETG